jgi:hypothetical protein
MRTQDSMSPVLTTCLYLMIFLGFIAAHQTSWSSDQEAQKFVNTLKSYLRSSGPTGTASEVRTELLKRVRALQSKSGQLNLSAVECYRKGCSLTVTFRENDTPSLSPDSVQMNAIQEFKSWRGAKYFGPPIQNGSGMIEMLIVLYTAQTP